MERWYRYVEAIEWAEVQKHGILRAGPNSCGDGKWVAAREADVCKWGEWLDPGLGGKVLVLEVPAEVAERMLRIDRLDGIGLAGYIECADLSQVRIVGALEKSL